MAKAKIVWDPSEEVKASGWTRFVCFSDTHGLHDQIRNCPEADVLLHAGDLTNTGEVHQLRSLAQWLEKYPAQHKVVIAGNHDITLQPSYYEKSWRRFHTEPYDCEEARTLLSNGCCTYLEDEATEVNGYRIYGSPWQPAFCDWAFNLEAGAACKVAWDKIPSDVDILITHGPPFGMNDNCSDGSRQGCKELLKAIQSRNVSVSIAGHLHSGYGVTGDGVTLFANASTCDSKYNPINSPIVFDLPPAAELREGTKAMAAAHPAPRAAWDEQDVSEFAQRELEHVLYEDSFPLLDKDGATQIRATSTTVSGEATAFNNGGKLQPVRIIVEFHMSITWKGMFEGKEVSGEIEVQDLDSSDLDSMEFCAKAIGPSNMEACKKAAEALQTEAKPVVKRAADEMCRRLSWRGAGLGCFR